MSTNSFPVSETSRLLNTSDFTIRRLIKTKELRAVRIGGQWRIFEEDLRAYLSGRENRPREVTARGNSTHLHVAAPEGCNRREPQGDRCDPN
jgi:excisionase family DNA binding protein